MKDSDSIFVLHCAIQSLIQTNANNADDFIIVNSPRSGRLDHLGTIVNSFPHVHVLQGGIYYSTDWLWSCCKNLLWPKGQVRECNPAEFGTFLHRWVCIPDFCDNNNMLQVLWSEKDEQHVQHLDLKQISAKPSLCQLNCGWPQIHNENETISDISLSFAWFFNAKLLWQ